MSTTNFSIDIHTFPGQHIRNYPGATRHSEQDVLYLEAKQYIPLSNLNPGAGDITIIATHAVSFAKELYEPLWDDLLQQSEQLGFRIRSIWSVDASNSGASGILNEQTQGDDPSFFDYPRDLLHMTNLFRDAFSQPVVGIGHSMGGTALIQLAHMHPRLMSSLVLFDPVLGAGTPNDFASLFYMNSIRPDLWTSREAAEKASNTIFKDWDARVLAKWMEHGLRDTPTLVHSGEGRVTLRTPKAQEAWLYGRNWFQPLPADGGYVTPETRAKYPDLHSEVLQTHPFYRPEDEPVWDSLPRLRPGLLFICPENGPMTDSELHEEKLTRTGSGVGGSGGVREGRVSMAVVPNTGHLLPFESPAECARLAANWVSKDIRAWEARAKFERENRDDKSVNKAALSETWLKQAKTFFIKSKKASRPKL